MSAYDHWKTTDFEGEDAEQAAELYWSIIEDEWGQLGYRERAEMVHDARSSYRKQYGYSPRKWVREHVAERLFQRGSRA